MTTWRVHLTGERGMPQRIRAIVFDFDDTIAETLAARIEATRLTFTKAGIHSPSPEEFVAASRGVPLQVALDSFDGGRGAEMELVKIYRSVYWLKEPGFLRMFPGVQELLVGLSEAGYPMGVLTSKARDILVEGQRAGAVMEMAELGITGLFQATIGVEDVTHPKPHPEGLERLLDHLGVTPEQALLVGDSYTDIQAAHNAGCWSCLAAWGLAEDEHDLHLATPDLLAEHPSALLRWLVR